MVNEEWLNWRLDFKLKGLARTVSDHCPLILVNSSTNWGPKPFKFFNGWMSHPEFRDFCSKKMGKFFYSGVEELHVEREA
ncbi:hypothetical protein ACS0TY_001735 [Phlomoides rotata]